MKARFISADDLSLDTDIAYPPPPRMVRFMHRPLNNTIQDSEEIAIDVVTTERHYELYGNENGILIYREIAK